MDNAKRLCLDISRIELSPDGVCDFVWPLDRSEVLAVRDRFLIDATAFLRSRIPVDRAAEVFALNLLSVFLVEVLTSYSAQAVVRRLTALGREPDLPPQSHLTRCFLAGRPPDSSRFAHLLRGLNPRSDLHRIVRGVKDRFARGTIKPRPLRGLNCHSEIVTIALGEMIRQHASATAEPVYYVRFDEWFEIPQPHDKPGFCGPPGEDLITSLLGIVGNAFATGGEKLSPIAQEYLQAWIKETVVSADRLLTRLLARPERVPRRLWRGTGGHLYSRILGHACRELGGQVTGHDHAQGQGIFVTPKDSAVEYPGCDRFMVWTEGQRRLSLKNVRDELLLGRAPEICVVPGIFRPKIPNATRQPKNEKIRTIMYVCTGYGFEAVHTTPLIPDIVLIDWEARLIRQLVEWGYEVLIKPHPESKSHLPRDYFDSIGAKIIDGHFEDVYRP